MRMTWRGGLVVGLGLAIAAPALADTRELSATSGKVWKHKATKTEFPVMLAELARDRVVDFGQVEADVAATYRSADGRTEATLYLYQAGLTEPSIWADRILTTVRQGRLGQLDNAALRITPFQPPQDSTSSGVRFVAPLSGKVLQSTSAAVWRRDNWILVVRLSSADLEATALDQKLDRFLSEMRLTKPKARNDEGYVIEQCADSLNTVEAKRSEPDMAAALLSGALMQAVADGKVNSIKSAGPTPRYCRDASSGATFGVYRLGGRTDAYTIAFGDAGVAGFVAPDGLAGLLDKAKAGQYSVSMVSNDASVSFLNYEAMPSVKQAVDTIMRERAASSSPRIPGKKSGSTINLPN